ncbi:tryptophan 2,3-dioxygenase [Acidobacteria bacterium Mor1]|nr:tryptophan 2,3-dioxygenase [Acidobacteria bacterium Mor1]
MELTYGTYLHIERLLQLQEPRSEPAEHDETLFIIIHQTYELWFKQLIHEFDKVRADFSAGDLYAAIHTFKRTRTIMKTLVQQLDILETMTPTSFSAFRDRLDTASGFQSVQFRELEFQLGYKRPETFSFYDESYPGYERLRRRLTTRSVVDHFYDFLEQRGAEIPEELRKRPADAATAPSEPLQDEIVRLHESQPDLVILIELMTDFDEGQQEWRYRHVKMVERTIGNKRGTGGSLGVEFLRKSLFKPVFEDLWAIRHRF